MRRTDTEEELYSNIIDHIMKGFPNDNFIKTIQSNCTEETIPKGMNYRPDKVAEYFLGNSNLAWMILFANNFENGIEDIEAGRTIKIPNLEALGVI